MSFYPGKLQFLMGLINATGGLAITFKSTIYIDAAMVNCYWTGIETECCMVKDLNRDSKKQNYFKPPNFSKFINSLARDKKDVN